MPKRYTSRDLIRLIERDGWHEVAQTGSHKQFRHPMKSGRVTIVHPDRDVHPKTAKSVLRRAGLLNR